MSRQVPRWVPRPFVALVWKRLLGGLAPRVWTVEKLPCRRPEAVGQVGCPEWSRRAVMCGVSSVNRISGALRSLMPRTQSVGSGS